MIGFGQSQTYVPDDNFEQELINLGYDNILDNFVNTSNIDNISSLYLPQANIYDLTGIEDFISLDHLTIYLNQLTSLDISQNTELTFLNCSGNLLTTLDVSQNSNLTHLYCDGWPTVPGQLTSLITAGAYSLEIIDCSDNQLNNIDVSQNTNLRRLIINGNLFTSFNLSSNTKLEELYCQYNQLTSLNTSGADSLHSLYCFNNELTSLDVSQNISLVSLACYNNNLIDLNLKNGNNHNMWIDDTDDTWSGIHCSNNPYLDCILVDDSVWSNANWITSYWIDPQHYFSNNCNGGTQQTYVPDNNFEAYLESNGMGNGIANDDSVFTHNIDTLTFLDINFHNISDLTGIEAFTGLNIFLCEGNQLTSLDVSNNIALTVLNCSTNVLTSLNLSQNTALEYLECGLNQLTSLDLSTNTALTELNCYGNELTSLDVRNGNNTNLTGFWAENNPNLFCIDVDDPVWSATNWPCDPWSSFSYSCGAPQTYVPDDNFEQALITLGYDNVLDDSVITANINTVNNLDISSSNISDLTGIEAFTALTSLNCHHNEIFSLDLSQNTDLTLLNCSINLLTTLNVSNNTALTYLDCSINALTSLDVSQNTALTSLDCSSNQLPSLDVSQNADLTEFYCAMNQLTSLDVRNGNNTNLTGFWAENNPNLFCIDVDDPVWSTANWTVVNYSIDAQHYFSNNCNGETQQTYLPDDSFEAYLEANGMGNGIANDDYVFTSNINTVTSLYVSSQNIADLTGIEDFVSLTDLNCASNQLTNLDVSQNTALTNLFCYDNQIQNLDLSNNLNLSWLWCENNQLTYLDITQNVNLVNLTCHNNNLTYIDLSGQNGFINLYLFGNNLSSLDLSHFACGSIAEPWIDSNPDLECIQVNNVSCWDSAYTWGIDTTFQYFSTNCSLPTSIEEHTKNKELLKVTDVLGRETKGTKNEVFFYIYDNGTVEKRIVIE
tara:strand:- start:1349 stop:4189 length:2841 start_codon:yes stop_codon:yes gene_type:complete